MCPTRPARGACSTPPTRSTRCSPPTTRRPLPPSTTWHGRRSAARVTPTAGSATSSKLHGMGDDLYAEVIPADRLDVPCRVYAPVGSHEDLLPYLVRRLLENGDRKSTRLNSRPSSASRMP